MQKQAEEYVACRPKRVDDTSIGCACDGDGSRGGAEDTELIRARRWKDGRNGKVAQGEEMEQCSTEEMCTKLCDNGQPSVTKTKPARKSSERRIGARLRVKERQWW